VIQHFRERQHAFRLGADVHYNVCRSQLENRAFDYAVFSYGFFRLRGEVLESRSKVLAGVFIVRRRVRRFCSGARRSGRSLIRLGLALLSLVGLGVVFFTHSMLG
jgi:hypothetical protein